MKIHHWILLDGIIFASMFGVIANELVDSIWALIGIITAVFFLIGIGHARAYAVGLEDGKKEGKQAQSIA